MSCAERLPVSEALFLYGAVRSVPKRDCIGIPVFSAEAGGPNLFCETDDQLRITNFAPLSEEAWEVEPLAKPGPNYEVGSYVPVPYWIGGKLKIVAADTPVNRVEAGSSPVAKRVERTLRIAQKLDRGEKERQWAQRFIADHNDLLENRGYSPKEWVLRFREALLRAAREGFSNRYVDKFLEEASANWAVTRASTSSWRTCEFFVESVQELGSDDLRRSPSLALALLNVLTRARSLTPIMRRQLEQYRQDSEEGSLLKTILATRGDEERVVKYCLSYVRYFRNWIIRADGTRALTLSEAFNGFSSFGHTQEFARDALEFKRNEIFAYGSVLSDQRYRAERRNLFADAAAHRLYNDIKVVGALLNVLEGTASEPQRAASLLNIPPSELHSLRQASSRVMGRQRDIEEDELL